MHTRLALFAGLSLAVAAVLPSRAAGAGPAAARAKGVSLAPLFDTQTRFKVKKTAALRFRLEPSGTRVRSSDVSFSLREGEKVVKILSDPRCSHDLHRLQSLQVLLPRQEIVDSLAASANLLGDLQEVAVGS